MLDGENVGSNGVLKTGELVAFAAAAESKCLVTWKDGDDDGGDGGQQQQQFFTNRLDVGDSGTATPQSSGSSSVGDGTKTVHPDPFGPVELPVLADEGTPWRAAYIDSVRGWIAENLNCSEMTCVERLKALLVNVLLKAGLLLVLLYLFICSLGMLSNGFRLIGGKAAGEVFRNSAMLTNPIAGIMIGVLSTVLLQSSSTSTSIIVGMVASEILNVRVAIPMVMGANIGTSMTNTIVSVAHSGRRAEFRRAFAGATVHDMFNWLCVIVLLPLECSTGYLFYTSGKVIQLLPLGGHGQKPPKLLKHLTDPLLKRIIQLDKSKIKAIAMGSLRSNESISLIKRYCDDKTAEVADSILVNGTDTLDGEKSRKLCSHVFAGLPTSVSDGAVGALLLLLSLAGLILCLVFIVKLLHSMLSGSVARTIQRSINRELPGRFACATGYIGIPVGALFTMLLQSSSVFTSALTPLVGIGVLSLERMYPLTLGANVGTTFTSVLAALASPPQRLNSSLQISLCHFLFNVTGIVLFYPIPLTRQMPIGLAKMLGNETAKYRWFAGMYIMVMFFLFPGAIFGLSMAGPMVMTAVGTPVVCILLAIILINVLQSKCPSWLPKRLRSWHFLPKWTRSLEPMDSLLCKLFDLAGRACPFACCSRCVAGGEEGPGPVAAGLPHTESRRGLLQTTPGASKAPSRYASRASSPKRHARQASDEPRPASVRLHIGDDDDGQL